MIGIVIRSTFLPVQPQVDLFCHSSIIPLPLPRLLPSLVRRSRFPFHPLRFPALCYIQAIVFQRRVGTTILDVTDPLIPVPHPDLDLAITVVINVEIRGASQVRDTGRRVNQWLFAG